MIRLGAAVALIAYGADRITKYLAVDAWDLAGDPVAVTPFFNLVLVWNPGISFGLLQSDSNVGRFLLTAFALCVIGALAVWLARARSPMLAAALGLVIGGAAGNVTDRIAWGSVADFFDFHLGGWHFPVFNVADAAIFCGFVLIVADGLFSRTRRAI